jgi:leucyl/phenylalanyl-tRNA--protein transferase
MRIDPGPSEWGFPGSGRFDPDDDLVAAGADLAPATLLAAYRRGLFPMPSGRRGDPMLWFCPVRRGVIPLDGLRIARSLRRSRRRFEIRVNTACAEVVDGCADPRRPAGWIDTAIRTSYLDLHRLGWVHSVEAWREGRLAGGLYGVSIGGLFAGESMFHRETDASKVALAALVDLLDDAPGEPRLLDVQWVTPHLASLGAVEMPRREYLRALPEVLAAAVPAAFG